MAGGVNEALLLLCLDLQRLFHPRPPCDLGLQCAGSGPHPHAQHQADGEKGQRQPHSAQSQSAVYLHADAQNEEGQQNRNKVE